MQALRLENTLNMSMEYHTEQSTNHYNETQSDNVILPYEKSGEFFVEDLGEVKDKFMYAFLKRTLDIVCSLVGLIILAIPMLIIAFLINFIILEMLI